MEGPDPNPRARVRVKYLGVYEFRPSSKSAAVAELKRLQAQGDVVPALLARLEALQPGTTQAEYELLCIVELLGGLQDERMLPGLEKLSKVMAQITHDTEICSGPNDCDRFPFFIRAENVVREYRVAREMEKWEIELKGLGEQERINRLADAWWLPQELGSNRALAALRLLYRVSPAVMIRLSIERVPAQIKTKDEVSLAIRIMTHVDSWAHQHRTRPAELKHFLERMLREDEPELSTKAKRMMKEHFLE